MKTGGPAFHIPEVRAPDGTGIMEGSPGMTLRDWFAGQALSGWLASFTSDAEPHPEKLAKFIYELADSMLSEREKGGGR